FPMPVPPAAIVRVLDVRQDKDGRHRLVIASRDQLREITCGHTAAAIGDILELSGDDAAPDIRKLGGVGQGSWHLSGDAMRWRRPMPDGRTGMSILQQRLVIRRAVRHYFDSEGFLEVDSPLLVRGTTPDASIQSFSIGNRYLATSTEYQLKRMIAGG